MQRITCCLSAGLQALKQPLCKASTTSPASSCQTSTKLHATFLPGLQSAPRCLSARPHTIPQLPFARPAGDLQLLLCQACTGPHAVSKPDCTGPKFALCQTAPSSTASRQSWQRALRCFAARPAGGPCHLSIHLHGAPATTRPPWAGAFTCLSACPQRALQLPFPASSSLQSHTFRNYPKDLFE